MVTPMASVPQSTWSSRFAHSYAVSAARLSCGTSYPSSGPSCVVMMITPTAEMNPAIKGSERKRMRNPSRPSPSARWIAPTSSASVAA